MKRIFTFLTACSLGLAGNSQTYFADDFEGGSLTGNNAWTIQDVSNTDVISTWILGTVSGNYAKISNYASGANHVLESWLISPSIDLSSGTAIDMSFDMTKKYTGDDMKVMISTNYSGSGLPSTATWVDITSLFTLDTDDGSWTFVPSGNGDISTYNVANVYIAFEYTGSATDGSTWEVDNVLIQENGTPPPAPTITSIYDIQYTTDASGDSPKKDSVVTTRGVVTGVFQIGSNAGKFFIQDGDGAWNGIYVYESGTPLALGDSVLVTGTVQEYNSLTEIGFVSDITILNSGNAMPTPVDVTGTTYSDEMYEGVLVRVVDVNCTTANDQYGVWTLNDGSDILVDDDCMPATYNSTVGNHYSVIGVRHLSFGENKIYPRDEATDITITGYNSLEENTSNISIYPNPASTNVTVKGVNGQVDVYSISGAKVYSNVVNGTLLINVEDLTNGVYFIKVTENNVISTYKLIVE